MTGLDALFSADVVAALERLIDERVARQGMPPAAICSAVRLCLRPMIPRPSLTIVTARSSGSAEKPGWTGISVGAS
jgi:hypothetical protein